MTRGTIGCAVLAAAVALAACSPDPSDAPVASEAPTSVAPAASSTSTGSTARPTSVTPSTTTNDVPADFDVQPGTEQVAVLGATPGAEVTLVDAAGDTIASGDVDELGSLLFREVEPGAGYALRAGPAVSGPFAVAGPDDHPDAATLADQPLLPAGGFGYVTVRDGTTLSANVVLPGPADGGPYPTVVEYSGYAPSDPGDATFAQVYTSMGFAYVGVNMRGTGCSGGSFRYFETVQSLDGYDVVEAVAAQPWVQGHEVGMVGISYPGISQLFVAATQPPSLSAITPLSVIDDSYRATLYPGGILNSGFAVRWTGQRMAESAPFGQAWTKDRADAGDTRCADNQALRLQNPDLVAEIGDTPFYSETVGDALAPITFVERIDVPVFLAGAWQDEQTGGHFPAMLDRFTAAPHLYATMVNGLHTEALSPPIFGRYAEFLQLYVGKRVPSMTGPNQVVPVLASTLYGTTDFVPYAERFAGMTYEEALAAYEQEDGVHILLDQGAAPGMAAGSPYPGDEAVFDTWPPPVGRREWFLGVDGMFFDEPLSDGSVAYTADPAALPPTFYSGSGSGVWRADVTYDWRPIPQGTGLGFVTAPLEVDATIVGGGVVEMWISTDAVDTDIEATLSEVRPDGTEIYVQSGWLRASLRTLDPERSTELQPVPTFGEDDVAPLVPGEVTQVSVPLLPVAHVLRAGSRLRLTIDAPGNNRAVWEFVTISDGEQVTVSHGAAHPSRLVLPLADLGASGSTPPPACGSLRGQPCRTYVPASNGG